MSHQDVLLIVDALRALREGVTVGLLSIVLLLAVLMFNGLRR
jgi:hypothetical protein